MTFARLVWLSLTYHWRGNVAVLMGTAVGTAVLTGALLVGDSMRGSLRDLTLERLGKIDHVLAAPKFFRADLAERLASEPSFAEHFASAASAILIQGSVESPQGRFVAGVNLIGTTDAFCRMVTPEGGESPAGQVVVNHALADALGLTKPGDRLIARVEKPSPIPKEGVMGNRSETTRALPVVVARIIPTAGAGRFGLDATQRIPLNLYVPLEQLASVLDQAGRANALVVAGRTDADRDCSDAIQRLLAKVVTLDDEGLSLRASKAFGYVALESRRLVLEEPVVRAAERVASETGSLEQPILSYLANSMTVGDRSVPYSIITALRDVDTAPLGPLPTRPANVTPKRGEILLNRWTVDQLSAKAGDEVRVEYYAVDDAGALQTQSHAFRLAGMVEMAGIALDRDFTPTYPGITDADTFGDWDPPFPVDLKKVRPADEKYWDEYRTTPKAFVSLEDGEALWTTRFGRLTSIRFGSPNGTSAEDLAKQLETRLLSAIDPASLGMTFQPIKALDLQASQGSTDFGQLFLAFSFFLIVSAALLVGLMFRLNVERRASQVGLLLAVGTGISRTRMLILAEGLLVAVAGGLIGLIGAIAYAQAMIGALTTWWQSAVNTPFITFHATAASLVIGTLVSIVVSGVAMTLSVARLGKIPVPTLLARGFAFGFARRSRRGSWSRWFALAMLLLAVASFAATPAIGASGAFFSGGACLLAGALALLADRLGTPASGLRGGRLWGIGVLGTHNARRYPGRSLLSASLIACATFVVVAVGAMRHGEQGGPPSKKSGDGGFALVGTSAVPLYRDLATPAGRDDLGVQEETGDWLAQSEIFSLRMRAGDDASCLNIYRPRDPTLLGIPPRFQERGGFAFAQTLPTQGDERANPWLLLDRTFDDGAIPAIGDMNTLMWILKVNVGGDLELRDEAGEPIRLRIVAGLSGSVFQGELLVSEKNLLSAFPSVTGSRFFLIATSQDVAPRLASSLAKDLSDQGMVLETTARRLANFKAVENTYMGAFQTLGGLGLVLGTLGLAAVILRNVLERRGELGLLRALGFSPDNLGWLILAENAFLLFAGLGIGSAAAILAVAPQLVHLDRFGPVLPVAGMLGLVVLAGMASGLVAVASALRTGVIASLRAE